MKYLKDTMAGALLSDTRSFFGILIIAIATVISIAGAYMRPDSSKNANHQNLAIARQYPGFTVSFLQVPIDERPFNEGMLPGLFFGGFESQFESYPYDSLAIDKERTQLYWKGDQMMSFQNGDLIERLSDQGQWMSEELLIMNTEKRRFLLGTDSFGRDMLSRLMAGTLVSLSVGLISVLISLVIGITLGAIAGYYRGLVDNIVMWFINVIWSIPTLLMVIAITLVMGKGFVQVFIAVGLTMWVEVARIVRGQFISLRELPYIEAGRSMGFSPFRIIFKHMLPNAMGPVIVISAANFAAAILIEAGLSFLGIGTQIPMPSWGTMIKEHYAYITTDMAYLAILPGLCITVLVLAFMLLGNRLRDVLDVRA